MNYYISSRTYYFLLYRRANRFLLVGNSYFYVIVWGVGPSTAEQWYCQGLRSLDDLKRANSEQKNLLNKHQKIGLDLFDDLDERMDRSEAAQIETYVRKSVSELNSSLEVIACGSFRRGKGQLIEFIPSFCSYRALVCY